jgi:hypothetical protein
MRHFVLSVATAWFVGLVLFFGITKCVDVANAIEPTTLEEALERPVKVEKYVDKENNVACYWVARYPKYLSCLQITDVSSAERAK